MTRAMLNGILLVDKPIGPSSFGVVFKIRGVLRSATGLKKPKVGHTGTLDPLASGLLVMVLGTYCKRAGEFSKLDKEYEVELTLGATSTTDDSEGQLTFVSSDQPAKEDVERVVQTFIGKIKQVPPIYSAIKVDGQRAYKLARKGSEVQLAEREVTVYEIQHLAYAYPTVRFTVSVSSGTYIRSLARDIGKQLGVGAYMSSLRRTQVGEFSISDAQPLDRLDYEALCKSLRTV